MVGLIIAGIIAWLLWSLIGPWAILAGLALSLLLMGD
jgi:TM2 domain-containing membrane protein YozV